MLATVTLFETAIALIITGALVAALVIAFAGMIKADGLD